MSSLEHGRSIPAAAGGRQGWGEEHPADGQRLAKGEETGGRKPQDNRGAFRRPQILWARPLVIATRSSFSRWALPKSLKSLLGKTTLGPHCAESRLKKWRYRIRTRAKPGPPLGMPEAGLKLPSDQRRASRRPQFYGQGSLSSPARSSFDRLGMPKSLKSPKGTQVAYRRASTPCQALVVPV
jgi:hypothetical protein